MKGLKVLFWIQLSHLEMGLLLLFCDDNLNDETVNIVKNRTGTRHSVFKSGEKMVLMLTLKLTRDQKSKRCNGGKLGDASCFPFLPSVGSRLISHKQPST